MKRKLSEALTTESPGTTDSPSGLEGKKRKVDTSPLKDAPRDGIDLSVNWDFCSEFQGGSPSKNKAVTDGSSDPSSPKKSSDTETITQTESNNKTESELDRSGFAKFGGLGFSAASPDKASAESSKAEETAPSAESASPVKSPKPTESSETDEKKRSSPDKGGFGTSGASGEAWSFGIDSGKDNGFSWDFSGWSSGNNTSQSTDKTTKSDDTTTDASAATDDFKFEFESSGLEFGTDIRETIVPIAKLEGKEIDSGDKSDETLLSVESVKVYKFEQNEWKEKGEGPLNLNVIQPGTKYNSSDQLVGRVLCRRDKIGSVLCNAPILVGGLYKSVNKTRIQFVAPDNHISSDTAESDAPASGVESLVTYCLKPRDSSQVAVILETITKIQSMIEENEKSSTKRPE